MRKLKPPYHHHRNALCKHGGLRRLFVWIILLLFVACQKESPYVDVEAPPSQEEIIKKAKDWYQSQLLLASDKADIDLRTLTPRWDKYQVGKNSKGQLWISLGLKNEPKDTTYSSELMVVIDEAGDAHGLIKKFAQNPFKGNSLLTIYTGDGNYYLSGLYLFEQKTMRLSSEILNVSNSNYTSLKKQLVSSISDKGKAASVGNLSEPSWQIDIVEVPISPPKPPSPNSGSSGNNGNSSGGGGAGGGGGSAGGGARENNPTMPIPPTEIDYGGQPPAGTEDEIAYYIDIPPVSIDLKKRLDCFNKIPSVGAQYSIQMQVDLPNSNNPNANVSGGSAGHVFLTMTKSNGGQSHTLSFGFYPSSSVKSLSQNWLESQIVDETARDGRESNINIEMKNLGVAAFNTLIANANQFAAKNYHLTYYNCAHYALEVLNSIRSQQQKITVPDSFFLGRNLRTVPAGVYRVLEQMRLKGDQSVKRVTGKPVSSPGC